MRRNLIVVVVVTLSFAGNTWSATINVPADQGTIQAGIDAAVNGDEVVVSDGTYNELINFNGKAITLRSQNGAGTCTIDGGGAGTVVTCNTGEGADTVLQGFTITGGDAALGGGMMNIGSSPTVNDCIFILNSGSVSGGGMYNNGSSPTIENCVFENNTGFEGGGISSWGGIPTIRDCQFIDNTAPDRGGGLFFWGSSRPVVLNCILVGNISSGVAPSVGGWGGGVAAGDNSVVTLTNCTLTENLAVNSAGGYGTEISSGVDDTILTNSIFWNNFPNQINRTGGGIVIVGSSCIQGGWGGPGSNNISANPLFIDAANANVRLQAGSPCIDVGDNSVVTVSTDLDGGPRIVLGTVDMGAYEFGFDCNGPAGDGDSDGIPDENDNCPCYPNPTQEFHPADFDEDCDVDGVDFSFFASAFNKAGNPPRSTPIP